MAKGSRPLCFSPILPVANGSDFCYKALMRTPPIAKALLLLLLPLLLISLTGCSITHAMRVENREIIDIRTMTDELSDSPLLFVGERHDASSHHQLQLEIIKSLKAEGKSLAIGMEMFDETSQPALDAWSAGKVPEDAFRKVYQWSWRNIPWGMYSDILLFARDHRIPVVALNAPREIVQAVAKKGFAALTPQQLKKLPPDVDARASDSFQKFMLSYAPSHGKTGAAFKHIAEAQLLRNMIMARRISDYLELHPERVMVVIAGGGHARGTGGVPEELRKDLPFKIVLPPLPPLTGETVTVEDADYLLVEPF